MAAPKLERLKAADVCQIAQVQPYVLRTWEAEFPDLGQVTAGGPRIYGRADVERVLKIRELSGGITETSDWATSQIKPEYVVEAGDVIFAWSASLMVKVTLALRGKIAPRQRRGRKALIGVKAKRGEPIGRIGPWAERL